VEARVQQRLAAGQRDEERAEVSNMVDSPLQKLRVHRRRHVIVLVAVSAGEIAPARDNELDEERTPRRSQDARAASETAEWTNRKKHRVCYHSAAPRSAYVSTQYPSSTFRPFPVDAVSQ
jgi:hypothetical protein